MICDFLELGLSVDGQDILSDFLPNNNLKEFVRNMGVNMTYADHVIVEYMSRMLEQPITVVRSPFHILIGQDYKDKPMLFLGYLADMHHYVSIKPERNRDQQQDGVTIETEQHYAVDYIDRFYVGRVLKKGRAPGSYHMKFLHKSCKNGEMIFFWPNNDDTDEVFHQSILILWTSRALWMW